MDRISEKIKKKGRRNWKYCSVPQCKTKPNSYKDVFPKNLALRFEKKMGLHLPHAQLCNCNSPKEEYQPFFGSKKCRQSAKISATLSVNFVFPTVTR